MRSLGWPEYDGRVNITDDLISPWLIPGWNAQDIAEDSEQAGQSSLTGPFFPSNLSFVRVTGQYFDANSSGIPGFLTFYMSDAITVVDGTDSFRMPQRPAGWMDFPSYLAYNNWGNGVIYLGMGKLDATVFATDQTANGSTVTTDSGMPLTYWVTEHFIGGRQYQISVPSSDSPGPVDINTLIVPGSIQPYAYDPVNPMGNSLVPLTEYSEPMYIPVSQDLDGGNAFNGGSA